MSRHLLLAALVACAHPVPPPAPQITTGPRTISIVGTNDLHGALDRLPLFGGFIHNLREARAKDGGAVVLIDAGDLFQGTLESNLAEGADVIKAYNQLGYAAAALGNHEFDFGPVGSQSTAKSASDDPRGALKARIGEAKFPFLVSNIIDQATSERLAWPNLTAATMIEVEGTKIGIVGASSEVTPFTTMPANFAGLAMAKPTAKAIVEQAKALRAHGAQLVVLTIHAGSACKANDLPDDLTTCDTNDEIFRVLDEVPQGLIDVAVAGHTHAPVAHRIDGVAVIESYSSGRAFGRVDVVMTGSRVTSVTIQRPEVMCPLDSNGNPAPLTECHPDDYEGAKVVPDATVQKLVDEAMARTEKQRNESLGVTLAGPITKSYGSESIEGDWFGDLMLLARPEAQIALQNGGGLRADIPTGDLTYGRLFQAMPFDNRFAIVEVLGKHIRHLVTSNLKADGGIFSWGGVAVKAACSGDKLDVAITVAGKPLVDDAKYTVVTSDFLASGGDGVIGKLDLPKGAIKITDVIMRDAMADVLRKMKGTTLVPEKIFSPTHPRIDIPGKRPIICGAP